MTRNDETNPLHYARPERRPLRCLFPALVFSELVVFAVGAVGYWWLHSGLDLLP